MSTIALPRSFKTAMPQLRDPALSGATSWCRRADLPRGAAPVHASQRKL